MKNEFSSHSTGESASPKTAESVKRTFQDASQKVKEKAREVAQETKQRGGQYVERNKEHTADCLGSISHSLRETADQFEADHDPNIAHYTRVVATKLDEAASYLHDHSLPDFRHDAEDVARRHPVLFYGGMFTIGLAAARFLKASAEHDSRPNETPEFSEAPYSGETQFAEATGTTPTAGI